MYNVDIGRYRYKYFLHGYYASTIVISSLEMVCLIKKIVFEYFCLKISFLAFTFYHKDNFLVIWKIQ